MATAQDEEHFGEFFIEWPIWARLTLILGGVFVFVLCTAFLIKLVLWLRDRRLESNALSETAERGEMSLVGRHSDEVPFGINALIEDTEVDGVWNSKANTAFHGKRQKTRSTSTLRPGTATFKKLKKNPSVSSASTLDMADTGVASPEELTPFTIPSTDSEFSSQARPVKRKGKSVVISYKRPDVSPAPAQEAEEIVSALNNPAMAQEINTTCPRLQLRPLRHRPSTRKFTLSNRSKALSHSRSYVQSEDANSLEVMEAHRRFHAAESGQLVPRGRRHTDIVLTTPLAPSTSDSDDSDSASSRALSWPTRTVEIHLGKQLSRRAQRMEGPKPIPFRAFVESLPPARPPPSAWTEKTQAMVDAKKPPSSRGSDSTSMTSKHTPTSSTSSATTATPVSPTEPISIANTRARKVNNGFELLPAGTLQKGPVVKEFGLWPAPSLSANKKSKLRKRARSNSGNGRDSSESQRLGHDTYRVPIF